MARHGPAAAGPSGLRSRSCRRNMALKGIYNSCRGGPSSVSPAAISVGAGAEPPLIARYIRKTPILLLRPGLRGSVLSSVRYVAAYPTAIPCHIWRRPLVLKRSERRLRFSMIAEATEGADKFNGARRGAQSRSIPPRPSPRRTHSPWRPPAHRSPRCP